MHHEQHGSKKYLKSGAGCAFAKKDFGEMNAWQVSLSNDFFSLL